jgi:hypothetical protein
MPPPPPPPPGPYGYGAPSAPPPRRRSLALVIVVVVVVIILVLALLAVAAVFLVPKPGIQVASFIVYAPDNVCGLNATPIYYPGYNGSTGANQQFDLSVPNYNYTTCTVQAITTNTSGFGLSDVQVPLSIPANGTGSLNITLVVPTSRYSGSVNLDFA